jgi:hypothetical protein
MRHDDPFDMSRDHRVSDLRLKARFQSKIQHLSINTACKQWAVRMKKQKVALLVEHEEVANKVVERVGTADYRQRATDLLADIARQTKAELIEQGIPFDVFFVVPSSGNAVITFGTTVQPDPTGEQWLVVSRIVASVLQNLIGLDRTRRRELACGTTAESDVSD